MITTTSTPIGYVDNTTINPGWLPTPYTDGTTLISTGTTLTLNSNNMNKVQQTKVAVFKIARNEDNEITSAEFIKEMWVETKNGSSVDFEVARNTELGKYKASDLAIKTLQTLTF